jgi:hypothetical protein
MMQSAPAPVERASAEGSTARSIFDEELRALLAARLTIFVAVLFGMRALAIALLTLAPSPEIRRGR